MFGYVRPYKSDLLVRDWELYRRVYCGLCASLGRNYRQVSRLALTYDLTFFSLLFLSLQDESPGTGETSCPGRLYLSRKKMVTGDKTDRVLNLAADISVLLAYLKGQDDLEDGETFRGRSICLVMAGDLAKVKRRQPGLYEQIEAGLAKLSLSEQANQDKVLTELAKEERPDWAFAKLLADLTTYAARKLDISAQNPELMGTLSTIGCALGRWVYLIDALADLEEDRKRQEYNCLAGLPEAQALADRELQACELELDRYAAILPYQSYSAIIYNIICRGLPAVRQSILAGEKVNRL